MKFHEKVSTGMPGFDKTIDMLRMGDNVVWQIDKLEDYLEVVKPYIKKAREDHRRIVYFRFGGHAPVLKEADDIQVYYVDAAQGFRTVRDDHSSDRGEGGPEGVLCIRLPD